MLPHPLKFERNEEIPFKILNAPQKKSRRKFLGLLLSANVSRALWRYKQKYNRLLTQTDRKVSPRMFRLSVGGYLKHSAHPNARLLMSRNAGAAKNSFVASFTPSFASLLRRLLGNFACRAVYEPSNS